MTSPVEVWSDLPARPVRSLVLGEPGAGPEVVVVPGLGALGYLLPTLEVLAARTRVHLLDLPGFGSPRTTGCPPSVEALAGAAQQWLDAVPRSPVLLVGHSTGAQAALRAATAGPGRLAALVLSGVTFPPDARRLPALLARVLRTTAHERPRELPAVLPEYWRGRRRLPELLRSALADRPEDAVGRVRVPLLVVRGRQDRLCDQRWAERLAAAAPHGRLQVVPGAHNSVTTHPRQTATAWASVLG